MKRRDFLNHTLAGIGGSALLWFAPQAQASIKRRQPSGKEPILVVIFQRGAMDALMAAPPLNDPYLPKYRPNLYMGAGEGGSLELDGRFGLHPGFAPFKPLFEQGNLALIHGTGLPDAVRSHFDAQAFMENGTPGKKSMPDGWLNRTLAAMDGIASPFRAVAIKPTLPLSLNGPVQALAMEDLRRFRGESVEVSAANLEALYGQVRGTGANTAEAAGAFKLMAGRDLPKPGQGYPKGKMGRAFSQVSQLIRADVGLRVAALESEGWDTHRGQGLKRGGFVRASTELSAAVTALWNDLKHYHDRLLILTMTEFGRTVKENGSRGTDHGRASCFFALGGNVKGGKVYGDVPILRESNLEDGRDLPVTTDFREVLAEVTRTHLGIRKTTDILPGWRGKPLSFLKS